jgi:hypothetical protein
MKTTSWLKLLKDYSYAVGTQPASGADGVKIAVFRKGPASSEFNRAAAHRKRYAPHIPRKRS